MRCTDRSFRLEICNSQRVLFNFSLCANVPIVFYCLVLSSLSPIYVAHEQFEIVDPTIFFPTVIFDVHIRSNMFVLRSMGSHCRAVILIPHLCLNVSALECSNLHT